MDETVVTGGRADNSSAASWVGWAVATFGLAGVGWWIWAWTRVETLITDHVSKHGPLPASDFERSALYSNGTAAQKQLSADLSAISGLYPWGRGPLILGALMAFVGFALVFPQNRILAIVGMLGTVVLATGVAPTLWDTMTIALDILE